MNTDHFGLVEMDYAQVELRCLANLHKDKWYQRLYYWLIRHLLPKNTRCKLMYGGKLFHATRWHKECLDKADLK
jgi:hypothetical protein